MKCIIEHDPPCRRCRKANRRCVIQPKQSQRLKRSHWATAGMAPIRSPVPADAPFVQALQGDDSHWTNAGQISENELQSTTTATVTKATAASDAHPTVLGARPSLSSLMNDSLPAATPLPSVYSTSPVQFVKVSNGSNAPSDGPNAVSSTIPWNQSGKNSAPQLATVQQDLPVSDAVILQLLDM